MVKNNASTINDALLEVVKRLKKVAYNQSEEIKDLTKALETAAKAIEIIDAQQDEQRKRIEYLEGFVHGVEARVRSLEQRK